MLAYYPITYTTIHIQSHHTIPHYTIFSPLFTLQPQSTYHISHCPTQSTQSIFHTPQFTISATHTTIHTHYIPSPSCRCLCLFPHDQPHAILNYFQILTFHFPFFSFHISNFKIHILISENLKFNLPILTLTHHTVALLHYYLMPYLSSHLISH